jgi:hypothetical protein
LSHEILDHFKSNMFIPTALSHSGSTLLLSNAFLSVESSRTDSDKEVFILLARFLPPSLGLVHTNIEFIRVYMEKSLLAAQYNFLVKFYTAQQIFISRRTLTYTMIDCCNARITLRGRMQWAYLCFTFVQSCSFMTLSYVLMRPVLFYHHPVSQSTSTKPLVACSSFTQDN